ncbi:MAG: hypothetical protein HUK25_01990 [Treponema sp.]|nr:hypothetical protein [Treponema sp.]
MKASCKKVQRIIFSFIFTGCFLFLNTSCGLDLVYYISSPLTYYHQPDYNTTYADRYFEFATNEINDFNDFVFLGTEIYYKIYSRYDDASSTSDLVSEKDNLYSLSVSDNSTSAAIKMIETYKFQPLYCYDSSRNSNVSCLIPFTGENKRVYIRLTDYQDISDYRARVCYKTNKEEVEIGSFPVRRNTNFTTFNFGRTGDKDKKPEKGESEPDISYTNFEPSGDNVFYVALFAVAVGRDMYYTQYYSNILYLGCVPINVLEKDN